MMKIEIGKTYIDGYGNEVTIFSWGEDDEYPFLGDNYLDYTNDGRHYRLWDTDFDLVKEKGDNHMKLEIGKTYIDGLGREVTIVSRSDDDDYPFIGNDGSDFTNDGRYYSFSISNLDLVAEKEPTMKIEIGKTYINGLGDEVTIVSKGACDEYPFIANDGETYTKEGKYYRLDRSKLDLVKEKDTTPTMKIETTRTLKDGCYPKIDIEDGEIYVHTLKTKEDIKQAIESLQACLEALSD